jgi:hypothetical protein
MIKLISVACLILLTGVAAPVQKILFIGNSLTYSQEGIYTHLEKLAASDDPPTSIETAKSVQGGATLKKLWDKQDTCDLIRTGIYNVVILQEDIPETDVPTFREYARRFVEEVRRKGSRPVLLMAWSYQRLGWINMAEIAQAHRDAARELGVDIAPVGLAWQRSMKARPDLDLYIADREHPSLYGTYLAASVVYATVFAKNPSNLRYVPTTMTPEAGAFLRGVAWDTYQEWQK